MPAMIAGESSSIAGTGLHSQVLELPGTCFAID
jgi:hypothetical protein